MKRLLNIALLLTAATLFAACAHAQVIVIANPSVKSADVSKSDLKDVFTGSSSRFKDGSEVQPVLLRSGAVNDEFLSSYVGKPDSTFKAAWRSLVFSGQASMPKTLDSESAVVDYVAHNSGAVGYIGKATPHDGVKVLEVR
jgi:ABC-type phosphate transport system substrate-binding protein